MQRFREPVNGFTHLAGALLAALGLVWLVIITRDHPAKMVSVAIYGLCNIILYSASAAYHLSNGSERKILWLRRLDHAAIYLLIAGSYTPIFYNVLTGNRRWLILSIVWGLALLGVIYKLVFLKDAGYLSLMAYIATGWVGAIPVIQSLDLFPPEAVIMFLISGLIYLSGTIVFGLERPNFHRNFGHHELWHVLVMSGSAIHFVALMRCLTVGG